MDFRDFIRAEYSYALVGATDNRNKYGFRVFHDLDSAGFKITPVNPKKPKINSIQAVATLAEVKPKPDVAVFVVPPIVGLSVMEEAAKLGIKKLWFQPGAESDEIVARARELKLEVVADGSCIMVERKRLGLRNTKHYDSARNNAK